jgi:hypothetical protein
MTSPWVSRALIVLLVAAIMLLLSERRTRVDAQDGWARADRRADSLRAVIDHRLQVVDRRTEDAIDSMRQYHDSVLADILMREDPYIRLREASRHLPVSDKWRYMGVVAVRFDTAAAR